MPLLPRIVWIVALALLGVTLGCNFLSASCWPFEMLSALRMPYVWLGGAIALTALVWRRPWLGLTALTGLALNVWVLASVLWVTPLPTLATPAPTITLLQANLHDKNRDHARFLAYVDQTRPDVLALQEVTPHWISAFHQTPALMRRYPYQKIGGGGDTALLSRLPLTQAKRVFMPPYDSYLHARVWPQGSGRPSAKAFTLLVIHPEHPTSGHAAHRQRRLVTLLTAQRPGLGRPLMVVGDFNATPWSFQFRRLAHGLGVQDMARHGVGLVPTWPVGWGPLMIPLDNCLVSPPLRVLRRETGPDIGSDHLPVLTTLAMPASGSDS